MNGGYAGHIRNRKNDIMSKDEDDEETEDDKETEDEDETDEDTEEETEDEEDKCENCGKIFKEDEDQYTCDECKSDYICKTCIVNKLENVNICKECVDKAYPRKIEKQVIEKVVYKDIASPTASHSPIGIKRFDPNEKTEFD